MVDVGAAQGRCEVQNIGAVVAVEDDRADRLVVAGIAGCRRQVAMRCRLTGVWLSARLVVPIGWNARWMFSRPWP